MRLAEIRRVVSRQSDIEPREGETAAAERHEESRALIALAPSTELLAAPDLYRQAPFLAQLIATKDGHAQTRERRRASVDEAVAAYRAAANLTKQH